MKLKDSLDRACARRMQTAARPRILLLAILGFALVAPLLSGSALAVATGTDDAAPAVMVAGVLGGLVATGPLREEDPGDPSAGGGTPEKPEGDDAKLTIGQRLSSALASKATLQAGIAQRDETIAGHTDTITKITAERDAANTKLAEANERIATLEAEAAEVEKVLKTSEAEVEDLKGKQSTTEKKAQEKIASLGFPAGHLPAADDKGDSNDLPSTTAELEAELAKLPTHKEKSALIRRYEAARAE